MERQQPRSEIIKTSVDGSSVSFNIIIYADSFFSDNVYMYNDNILKDQRLDPDKSQTWLGIQYHRVQPKESYSIAILPNLLKAPVAQVKTQPKRHGYFVARRHSRRRLLARCFSQRDSSMASLSSHFILHLLLGEHGGSGFWEAD